MSIVYIRNRSGGGLKILLLDWLQGFATIIDGVIIACSLGCLFSSFAYTIVMKKLGIRMRKEEN